MQGLLCGDVQAAASAVEHISARSLGSPGASAATEPSMASEILHGEQLIAMHPQQLSEQGGKVRSDPGIDLAWIASVRGDSAYLVKYQSIMSGLVYGLNGYQPPRWSFDTMTAAAIGHHSEATSFDRKF